MKATIQPNDWEFRWGAWRGRIRGDSYRALMDLKAACPVYGTDYSKSGPDYIMHGDQKIAARAFAGALDWSPYVMFKLVFREAIAEHFNAKGVTTRKGRRWTGATVVKFLGSPGAKPCRSGGKDGPQGDVKG